MNTAVYILLQLIFYTQSIYDFVIQMFETAKSIYSFWSFVILVNISKIHIKEARQLFSFYILYINIRDK